MTQQALLSPEAVIEEFRKNGVTHVVYLPDSETNWMYQLMEADPGMDLIPVSREGESIAIAAGIIAGGKKPVVLIQNTGMFESGDSIRGLALDVDLPLVRMIGYRGWTRDGAMTDSAATFTEPILDAWGISQYLVETDADVERISAAFDEADRTQRPVACLMGAEYS